MKGNNIYSVAISYDSYLEHNSKHRKENNILQSVHNIFELEQGHNFTKDQLTNSKSYEVVGLKELRSYRNRINKKQKLTIRRDTISRSERPSSKETSNNEKQDLFNRQEIMDSLPKLIKNQTTVQLKKKKRQSWMTEFSEINKNVLSIKKKSSLKQYLKEFSVSRLKQKLANHQNQWKKAFHRSAADQKFPSIHKTIQLFRQKMEERERNSMAENLSHIKSEIWTNTLRNDQQMKDVCCRRQIVKTFHDNGEFTAKGISKLRKQQEWLQNKDKQGYRFKLHMNDGGQQIKKVMAIR